MSANKIATVLFRQIKSQYYNYGDRLPPERELAKQFQVARGTMRQALELLEKKNVLQTRAGSGSYVTYKTSDSALSVFQSTSPLELIDTRFAIEPQITKLAVLNATTHDIEQLAFSLEVLEKSISSREQFSDMDEAFHRSLVDCTHNALITKMHNMILEIRRQEQWQHMKNTTLTEKTMREYNIHHRMIFQGVQQRNVEMAVTAMEKHLQYARQSLVQASYDS